MIMGERQRRRTTSRIPPCITLARTFERLYIAYYAARMVKYSGGLNFLTAYIDYKILLKYG